MNSPLTWDVFCRVVDNYGDIGVCWRLAADLAGRGQRVRLWTDDASALRWMAPDGHPGVAVGACLMLAGGVHGHTWYGAALLLATGVLATVAQMMMTRAYAIGRALTNASLQYMGIVFSFIFGVLIFDDPVTLVAIAGMALIIGAGVAATRLRQRSRPAAAGESSSFES